MFDKFRREIKYICQIQHNIFKFEPLNACLIGFISLKVSEIKCLLYF